MTQKYNDIIMLNLFSGFYSLKNKWQNSTPYNRFFSLREEHYRYLCKILKDKCQLNDNCIDNEFLHYIKFSKNFFDFNDPSTENRILNVIESYKFNNINCVDIIETRPNKTDRTIRIRKDNPSMKDIIETSVSFDDDEIVSNYEIVSQNNGSLVLKATIGMWDHKVVC